MNEQQLEDLIRAYLPNIIHLSLGTSQAGRPWVCEVHFSYDDALNLYFRSMASTRHCQDIAANPQVAGAITTQHQPGQKPQGVYFEGRAERLYDVTAQDASYQAISGRYGADNVDLAAANGDGPHFYRIAVSSFSVFNRRDSLPTGKFSLDWPRS